MSKYLSDNYHLLQVLAKNKSSSLSILIIREARPSLIKAIAEICHNLINNSVIPLTPEVRNLIKRKKKLIHQVASKKLSIGGKKEILEANGAALLAKILRPSIEFLRSIIE